MVVDDCSCPQYWIRVVGIGEVYEVESVQLQVGKRLLGVIMKMTNAVVRGELGWWPMRAQRDMKLLLYWARLVRLEDSRLVKKVYRCRRGQAEYFVNDWCSNVYRTLMSIGLGRIWETEEVGSEKDWKILLKAEKEEYLERITDTEGWNKSFARGSRKMERSIATGQDLHSM